MIGQGLKVNTRPCTLALYPTGSVVVTNRKIQIIIIQDLVSLTYWLV